jgi:hemerythrin-like domain-containing protein
MLIQQHNRKEEHILYPMSENALGAEWTEIHERLAAYPPIA